MSCRHCDLVQQYAAGEDIISLGDNPPIESWLPPGRTFVRIGAADIEVLGCNEHLGQLVEILRGRLTEIQPGESK